MPFCTSKGSRKRSLPVAGVVVVVNAIVVGFVFFVGGIACVIPLVSEFDL